MKGNNRKWVIRGWDSTDQIFETTVKYGYFSENQMKCLLKALTAKHGLTDSEIVESYARKKTKISSSHLEVQVFGNPYCLSCGDNPYFTAQVEND